MQVWSAFKLQSTHRKNGVYHWLFNLASALAANSFARSSFAAAFPLFGIQSKSIRSISAPSQGDMHRNI